MKVYLDVCCLCRPFDDQTSDRIRMEAEAVIAILNQCIQDQVLVGSEVIEYEIARIPDKEKMKAVGSLLQCAKDRVMIDKHIVNRARMLYESGIDSIDALHLASAESAGALFLTTDDSLIKFIKRQDEKIHIAVYNPVQWLMEVTNGDKDAQ
jgi:predicted nucleic acid-binding protein